MGSYFERIDRFAIRLTQGVIRHPWLVILLSLLLAVAAGYGGSKLQFANNYRAFFSKANPELQAFEDLQATYTKNDNFLFVLEPAAGEAITPEVVAAVRQLTDSAWQIPYAIRVDSLSNFQHTYGLEDDLIVENLLGPDIPTDQATLDERRAVALAEPLLRQQLITPESDVTAVNVVLQYPEESFNEVPDAVTAARQLRDTIEADYPSIDVHLTGVSMLNNAFAEAGFVDIANLVPLMFVVIVALTWLILRTFWGTLATVIVIFLSTMIAMGLAGHYGLHLTPIAASAPIIILTLAIADSIHILVSLRSAMREGMDKDAAIVEALRVNFLPVSITSLTTIIGFLSLNFSDSPPFWHLGNITAMGIAAAWLYSTVLLPALMHLFPYRVQQSHDEELSQRLMSRLADFVLARRGLLLLIMAFISLGLTLFIPRIAFNDQWVEYFDERIEFRSDSDKALEYFGMYPVEFSVPAIGPGGVSEPEYLQNLESFTAFLRQQPGVRHVYSLTDIMKRLNKNLHSDNPEYYRIPGDRELSAQYLLLYELSLPYGLDLNDRINIDKSATRVTATLGNATTAETKAFLDTVSDWQRENWPDYMQAKPTSAQVMFTYITDRNVQNMIGGTIFAIVAIAIIMILALRSFRLGVLSLIPNGLPILAAFGAWSLLVGTVGFSVATVASISLGIIVDDTVHLLSKYVRARRERGLSGAESIRYAFRTVGTAIIVNTTILAIGFLVLTTSSFKINIDMGLLTALTIVFALILDFFLLPGLLMLWSGREDAATVKPGQTLADA
ncbi:MAG: MMPL family transporter [Wenzhouxiangellaceae bacterium]